MRLFRRENAMRFHTRLRRVLTLVDLLAPLRHGMSVEELSNDLQSKVGIRICRRSVHRDIALLLIGNRRENLSRQVQVKSAV